MANKKISDISRAITVVDDDDIMEVQSPALGATGSAKITTANMIGGKLLAYGLFDLDDDTQTLWTVPFGATLGSAPTRYELTFQAPSGNTNIAFGNALTDVSLTQFQIQLQGPIGDADHQVFWKAFK